MDQKVFHVDATVQGMVDKLGQAIKATPPDGKAAGELLQGIGNESCMKCHLVHLPAASSKALWKALPDLLK